MLSQHPAHRPHLRVPTTRSGKLTANTPVTWTWEGGKAPYSLHVLPLKPNIAVIAKNITVVSGTSKDYFIWVVDLPAGESDGYRSRCALLNGGRDRYADGRGSGGLDRYHGLCFKLFRDCGSVVDLLMGRPSVDHSVHGMR